MVRHTDDNDKKPRARQDERSPRPFKSSGPRKSGDGTKSFGDKPRGPRDDGAKRFGDKADRPRSDKPRTDKGGKDGKSKTPETPLRAERIAKTMARAGIASRREVERLIGLGKVAVNGRILDTPATLVTRDDVITVDGKPIGSTQATRVWRYHKPAGLLTSHSDPTGRPTVFDALPAGLPRVISVGRLDLATEGLLLLTNDGELSRALELPSTSLVRQYRARARGKITQEQLDALKDGVVVDGVSYGPIEAKLDKATIAKFQRELGAMGYKFQFVTLAGFHALNNSMFELADGYRDNGMAAYSELQQREFANEARGYTATRHQREVGTGYFDQVATVISNGTSSTTALKDSTETAQFTTAA
ncbi:MAG TPA: hypothetical protein DDY79_01400 [Brevundimonas sp.]|nr:hypothetical protein [Brevundimonas sp.]